MLTQIQKLIILFFSGGSLITLVSYLSNFVSTYYAALLWGFPFVELLTLYYLKIQKKNKQHISDYLIKTCLAISLLIIILLVLSKLVLYYSLNISILISFFIYIFLSIIFYYLFTN